MINIFQSPKIQKNISKKDIEYKTKIISDPILEKINKLIKEKDEETIVKKIQILKELWKKEYLKANNSYDKEQIFKQIFVNLEKLLNKLNYLEVYNSDAVIWKTSENYNNLDYIKNMVSIWGIENIEWANCNSWDLFIMETLKYITNNDSDIEYSFVIKKDNNHWMLYITLNNKIFLYHLDKHHQLRIKEKKVSNENYYYPENEKNYNNIICESNKIWIKKDSFSYRIWKKYFKLYIYNWNICIKINLGEDVKYIDFLFLKKISKKIYKYYKYRKKIWKYSNINNIKELKEEIFKKVSEEEYEFILIALKNFNEEKLNTFFLNKNS